MILRDSIRLFKGQIYGVLESPWWRLPYVYRWSHPLWWNTVGILGRLLTFQHENQPESLVGIFERKAWCEWESIVPRF